MSGEDEMIDEFNRALAVLEKCREFSRIIPEVRSNLVYAKKGAVSPKDVLAVDGRITVVEGYPRAAGTPRYGASSHMARLIIEIMKANQDFRAGINFANDEDFSRWLEGYCRKKKWPFGYIDRSGEPEDLKNEDKPSMPWKVTQAIRTAGGAPKVFYENSAVGKEPVSVLVGKDPCEVVHQICEIAEKNGGDLKWKR
jgi:hydroxymethylpyrimidine/phosphomethylpyrimidine kinase